VGCFKAYFDESGSDKQSPIIVVGGAIGEIQNWLNISKWWKFVLDEFNVKAFHASEYNTKEGEFSGWSDEKRRSFLNQLLQVIDEGNINAIAVIMEKNDYERALKKYPSLKINEYQFLCYACCTKISSFYRSDEDIPPIEVVFEHGQPFGSSKITDLANELNTKWIQEMYGIAAITRMRKSGVIPFQVADLIIYELFKAYMKRLGGAKGSGRYQAYILNQIMDGDAPKLDYEQISLALKIISEMDA